GFGDNITRGHVAVLIQKYLKLERNLEQKAKFTDTKGNAYEGAIEAVAQAGIMTGYDNGQFRPDGVLTRYEMSVVLQKVFQLNGNEKSVESCI
ncbi:S-layer homology domain-containing protein, partial [Paenibacillus sp. GbtcB18]|uniref:S-layer homology domain-containing protein n=1 Tax=Paenibacillus sp. GbtcB18 TaxID=2824763 RepID=UPI001C2F8965